MLHWYVAMGLSKQHHLQQVMLARVRDIGLAQTLVRVVQRVLCVGHASVRYLCKDEGDNALLCGLWCESNSIVVSESLPSVHSDVLAAVEHVRAGTALVDCMLFFVGIIVWMSCSPFVGSGGEVCAAIRAGGSEGRSSA